MPTSNCCSFIHARSLFETCPSVGNSLVGIRRRKSSLFIFFKSLPSVGNSLVGIRRGREPLAISLEALPSMCNSFIRVGSTTRRVCRSYCILRDDSCTGHIWTLRGDLPAKAPRPMEKRHKGDKKIVGRMLIHVGRSVDSAGR